LVSRGRKDEPLLQEQAKTGSCQSPSFKALSPPFWSSGDLQMQCESASAQLIYVCRSREHAASQLIATNHSTKMIYLHFISIHGATNRWGVIESLRNQIRRTATEKKVGYIDAL
jgi:hypothetical protein